MKARVWKERLAATSGWVFGASLAWILVALAVDRPWSWVMLPVLWGASALLFGISVTLS